MESTRPTGPTKATKIFGRVKAYGSVPHLPGSRVGPEDHNIGQGVYRICCEKTTHPDHRIIVQEKLDGTCVAVALVNGELHTMQRHGYPCLSSPHRNHHIFHEWAMANADRFRHVLREGERLVGEWLALAHGTLYDFASKPFEPFLAFDIIKRYRKLNFDDFRERVADTFGQPHLIHDGGSIAIADAMEIHERHRYPSEAVEGLVYRVQLRKKVLHVCKYVSPTKIDGKYLPSVTGKKEIWNWLAQ